MTYVGITPAGGNMVLPAPVSVKLNRTEGAPADGFTGIFPLKMTNGTITGLHIYDANHDLCFDGIVDEQKESCGGSNMLTLVARSRAALLLDNEAIPQTYCMPSLTTIFTRHVKPYGFSSFIGNPKVCAGELAVTKGMSEWQAVEAFCTKFLKVTPRMVDSALDASGVRPQGSLLFSQSGVKYSSITVQNKYCCLYSELLAQSGVTYSLAAQDSKAIALGVKRRRCLAAGTDADALIQTARSKAFSVTVSCPGEVPTKLLMDASVDDKALGTIDGLYISEIDYVLDSSGEITRFTLRRLE
jgi:hypothetical protein